MLDEDEARRQRIQRRRRAEKIPARDIDADAAEAQNTPPVNTTNSQSGGDEMGKMTVEELDQHRSRNRMKVCKPRALTVVPVSPVAIPQVAPAATSETAPASHPLVLDSSPRATYRAPVENASL